MWIWSSIFNTRLHVNLLLVPYQRNGFFPCEARHRVLISWMLNQNVSNDLSGNPWKIVLLRWICFDVQQHTCTYWLGLPNEIGKTYYKKCKNSCHTTRFRSTLSRLRFVSTPWKSPEAISFPLKIELHRLQLVCQQAQVSLSSFLSNKFSISYQLKYRWYEVANTFLEFANA